MVDLCLGGGAGCGSVVWARADLSHSVIELASVLIRILSRNRSYFPIPGAEVGVEISVSLECSRPELSFMEVLGMSVKTAQALRAQKQAFRGSNFLFHPLSFAWWGVGKAGCLERNFVLLQLFTPFYSSSPTWALKPLFPSLGKLL